MKVHLKNRIFSTGTIFVLFLITAFLICNLSGQAVGQAKFKVLIFCKTSGYHHGIIPQGIAEIAKLGVQNGFDVDATEDSTVFTDENLKQYKVIIFNNTTGNIFGPAQEAAFEKYIRSGGGWVGIHAATDTEYDWKWFDDLLGGAHFKTHPKQQKATVIVEDKKHPASEMLPDKWEITDELYSFRQSPRAKVKVLASLDENTYTGGGMGDHPIIWYSNFDGGRVFYTGLGHTKEVFTSPLYLKSLLGGILWAAGVK